MVIFGLAVGAEKTHIEGRKFLFFSRLGYVISEQRFEILVHDRDCPQLAQIRLDSPGGYQSLPAGLHRASQNGRKSNLKLKK
jgi:hypothetical protein